MSNPYWSKETGSIAAVHAKLNHAHPFPEGNGRATRALLSQLAAGAGYRLDFDKVSQGRWNHASALSGQRQNLREPALTSRPDTTALQGVFAEIATPIRAQALRAKLP